VVLASGLLVPIVAFVGKIDPFQRRELDVVDPLSRTAPADQLGLVEPHHRLGQGVIVGIAFGSDRGDGAGLGQSLGVADR